MLGVGRRELGGGEELVAGGREPEASVQFFATDSVRKFRTLGSRFLGRAIEDVRLVDLEKQGVGNRE
jgi:hypothetical protein